MIGKTISHYRIVEELGRGGMGIVYKAEDTKLKRVVALKFLPPAVGKDDKARFELEAQSAAHLQHPNICTIHEIDEADGEPFIAMAYIDGVELKALTAMGPMALDEAVSIAVQVATALEEAHEHHIVHRDIKSANVMVTKKGLAKVMDFGLAKRRGRTQITQAGTSLGTIDYMSPEQTSGTSVDHRADIWALGVMMYEMIAGQMPFRGEFDQAVIYSILNQDPEPISSARTDAPESLVNVITRAMAKRPEDRYQSVSDLLSDLVAVQLEVGVPTGSSVTGAINWSAAGTPSTGGKSAATPRPSVADATSTRRHPVRILGIYVVLSAVIVAVLHWLVGRFPISPNLPSFAFWALLALLPTVTIIAFARRGIMKTVGIPVNIIAAGVLLFSMFGDKDLGAATKTITVTDEEGNAVERVVPKSEFRKRVALFYFDNESGEAADDWMSYGLPHMIQYELSQDTYASCGMGFTVAHKEAGFDPPVGSPKRFKQKLALDSHFPHFITGTFELGDAGVAVDLLLHRTDDGSLISSRHYDGQDVFAIADSISVQLRRDLGIPEYHIAESTDLPVAEMYTSDLEAMENYVTGVNARWQGNDFETAAAHLKMAVDKDPAFAAAHLQMYAVYVNLNDGESAKEAVRKAVQHKYKLPERVRFSLMDDYHGSREDQESVLLNGQRWVSLYPDDVEAHLALAGHYERRGDLTNAIEERKKVFEISPERFGELHSIANLYEDLHDYEQAEEYGQRYAELFPDNYASYTWLAGFCARRGDFDRARQNYKRAIAIEPERMSIRTRLAGIEQQTGNFDEAQRQLADAMKNARTAQDSSAVLSRLTLYHGFRGQAKQALEYQEAMYRELAKYQSPIALSIQKMFTLGTYVDAGQPEQALAIVRDLEQQPGMTWMKAYVAAGYIITYSVIDDAANADEVGQQLDYFEEWVDQSGNQHLEWVVDFCRGVELEWRGQNEEALERLNKALPAAPGDATNNLLWMNIVAAECSRQLGSYAEAESFLNNALKLEPWSPECHYELAVLFHEQGRIDKAREHIEKALRVWEDADPEHRRAKMARELAELLRSSS